MPSRPQFRALRLELLRGSVASEYVFRTIDELRDHYDDLCDEARAAGHCERDAAAQARRFLGRDDAIAAAVLERDELKCWAARHRIAAACGKSLVVAAVAPAMPVVYCLHHRSMIARWSISVGLAIVLTASLLLGLESMLPIR